MDETLKACPFCGEAHRLVTDGFLNRRGCEVWVAECPVCGARGPEADNDDEAIAAWNRRTPDADAMRRALEEIAGLIDDMSYSTEAVVLKSRGIARAALSTTKGEG